MPSSSIRIGRPSRGGREAEAQEKVTAFAEGGALYVDRVVVLAHEAGPILAASLATLDSSLDQRFVGLLVRVGSGRGHSLSARR